MTRSPPRVNARSVATDRRPIALERRSAWKPANAHLLALSGAWMVGACAASAAPVGDPVHGQTTLQGPAEGALRGSGGTPADGVLSGSGATLDPTVPAMDRAVVEGELPWWHALKSDIYDFAGERVVLAIGDSTRHQHLAEGFLHAKVNARLAVRKAAESIRFDGGIPEPILLDLFVTRERRFLALYVIKVPRGSVLPAVVPAVAPPEALRMRTRRRVGRHIFEADRHLFLECDVEGPIANPDWGRTRASA